ncbi:glycosyltransferase [Azospirillum canadense]|nr:glycosyltransferase involved in cell wall biosynthesis [Azospirillum canadense]
MLPGSAPAVAVLIPCYNEEAAIASVMRDFRAALPDATLYVYDNNPSDRTVKVAKAAGAVVRREPLYLTCGLILDTVTLGRRKAKRMGYLAIPVPGTSPTRDTVR